MTGVIGGRAQQRSLAFEGNVHTGDGLSLTRIVPRTKPVVAADAAVPRSEGWRQALPRKCETFEGLPKA